MYFLKPPNSHAGKFGVIMADPPWEIHQELPYGTMGDEEMRNLNIGCLQDDGVIFLWVTGMTCPWILDLGSSYGSRV